MANRLICPNCGHEQRVVKNIQNIRCSVCSHSNKRTKWKNTDRTEIPNIMKKKIIKLLQEVGRIKGKEGEMSLMVKYMKNVFEEEVDK